MDNTETIIQVEKLSKRFGKKTALDRVSLDICRGRIVGLLGSNGAGKSTLLRHMIGLYLPDIGQCNTFGCNAGELSPEELGRIGYVHQEGELLPWMKVEQLIRYVSTYYPNWNHELEERYIKNFKVPVSSRVVTLSPGERQKLAILLAIGFDPELLILDEPASALDPIARANFLDLLLELIQDENRTIVISSHILSDVEKVIDHVVIMEEGGILLDCGFDDLCEKYSKVKLNAMSDKLPSKLPFENIIECHRTDGQAILIVSDCSNEELKEKAQQLDCWIEIETLPLEELYKIVVNQHMSAVGA
ncbi:MAG: ABC transporter ATP-binding protein [Sedimentisphaerales bacterium]|nr:ABC transporter ATP-binding protein [Sedimentisphaerales bacterium]